MNLLNCTPYTMYNLNIVSSNNEYVIDHNEKRYVDMESGVWCAVLGHNNKEINDVINKQIDQISHTGFSYSTSVVLEAAEELSSLLGFSDGKCLFLSSGSEAMEFAVQTAKKLAKKPHILALDNHHLSAYGISNSKEHWILLNLADINESNIHNVLDSIPFENVGVFVFEPGCASGTVRLPQKDIIDRITTRVNNNNAIIVVDEITTGMGRSGSWFGFDFYGIKPDIVACGKGLGNGYPVSAVIMNNNMAVEFTKSNIKYTQSHLNDPLGCAIAKKVIEIIKRDCLIMKSMEMGNILLDGLNKLKNKHPIIKEIRGRGLMIGVEFYRNKSNLNEIHKKLFDSGYIVGIHLAENNLKIYPPLTISPNLIEAFLIVLDNILTVEE